MDQMDTPDAYGVQLQAMHESRKLEQESTVAATSPARPRKVQGGPSKIFLGGLGTKGIVDGELVQGVTLASKDTLDTLNRL